MQPVSTKPLSIPSAMIWIFILAPNRNDLLQMKHTFS
jgi:hypothetical protein